MVTVSSARAQSEFTSSSGTTTWWTSAWAEWTTRWQRSTRWVSVAAPRARWSVEDTDSPISWWTHTHIHTRDQTLWCGKMPFKLCVSGFTELCSLSVSRLHEGNWDFCAWWVMLSFSSDYCRHHIHYSLCSFIVLSKVYTIFLPLSPI